MVVDQGSVAHGGSGRSSALVRMHYSFPPEVQLAAKSLAMFRNWPELVGRPGDFRKTGFVRIVPEGEIDRLRANVAMQRSFGINAEVLTAAELDLPYTFEAQSPVPLDGLAQTADVFAFTQRGERSDDCEQRGQ